MNKVKRIGVSLVLFFVLLISGCGTDKTEDTEISLSDVPEYSGEAYVEINNNQPDFTEE